MGSGGKPHIGNRHSHQFTLWFAEYAELAKLPTAHLSVGQRGGVFKAFGLPFSRDLHLRADRSAACAGRPIGQFVEWNRWYLDVDIDSI